MPLLITIIYSCLVIFLVIMPSPSCAFCGRRITGHVPGRAATAEQLERATAYHHPKTHVYMRQMPQEYSNNQPTAETIEESFSCHTIILRHVVVQKTSTHCGNSFVLIATSLPNALDTSQRTSIESLLRCKNDVILHIVIGKTTARG